MAWLDKKRSEMTSLEIAMLRAYGILHERANYWGLSPADSARATAYESAATILEAGMNENWEILNQFDYYGDNDDITEEWACTPAAVARECEV